MINGLSIDSEYDFLGRGDYGSFIWKIIDLAKFDEFMELVGQWKGILGKVRIPEMNIIYLVNEFFMDPTVELQEVRICHSVKDFEVFISQG